MLPSDLKPELFKNYPPEARELVTRYIPALQTLPISFLPSLLREVIDYDFKFPAERKAVDRELANLKAISSDQSDLWFRGFVKIKLTSALEDLDWINSPALFVEQLSAYLWTTHQLDAFREAAVDYAARLEKAAPPEKPAIPRLGIAVIGQGVATPEAPLFRKLRAQGAYFNRIKPENGMHLLLSAVAVRAKAHPDPYGHWYIDGGKAGEHDPVLTTVSYGDLEPVRTALLRKMRDDIDRPGMGPGAT